MKRFSIISLVLSVFYEFLCAQVPQEMITRDQYLDRLEARFRDASSELQQISGVKFEVPKDALSQPNPAQSAFDALPGPKAKPTPKITPLQKKSPNLLSDNEVIREIMGIAYDSDTLEMDENLESNSSIEEDEDEIEVVPPRFLEDEIGSFFVQPFIGLSLVTGDSKIVSNNGQVILNFIADKRYRKEKSLNDSESLISCLEEILKDQKESTLQGEKAEGGNRVPV